MIAAAAHGPSVLWYVTRGAGATTLVLLSASVVLGVAEVGLWRPAGAPRFAVAATHRTISLLALAFLAVHVVTTLLDPFPPIGWLAAAVPFMSGYRPLWTGLGTLASDLLVALALTSLVRRRLGYRAWRWLHWLAYACWPVAIAHGLGNGSDAKSAWMLILTLACVAAVVIAIAGRLGAAGTPRAARAGGALTLSALGIALALWLPAGPLAAGWARRAGTPATVLAAFSPRVERRAVASVRRDRLAAPFSATLAGRAHSGTSADGSAVIDMALRLTRGPEAVLRLRLAGAALQDGGLALQRSSVALGPASDPRRWRGRVGALRGTRLSALVGSRDGRALRLTIDVSLTGSRVSGRLRGAPVRRRPGP